MKEKTYTDVSYWRDIHGDGGTLFATVIVEYDTRRGFWGVSYRSEETEMEWYPWGTWNVSREEAFELAIDLVDELRGM